VLARRTFRCRAWDLGVALDWAAQRAAAKGWAGVTVACEPTGHRWRILGQLAGERSMPFVCVQPSMTAWARRSEDLTFDKTDEKDAVLIARLTGQCAATSRSRSTRRGVGCGTWVRAESS
jgi:transposase